MPRIPREKAPDSSLALLRDGYEFVSKRCERHQTDLFQARLLFQNTICMRGEAAARLFYDESRFTREGAAPRRVRKVLFGEGGVQGLDGRAHRVRKQMFMSLMTPEALNDLSTRFAEEWRQAIPTWEGKDRIALHPECQTLLCRAACGWAGVPLKESEVEQRTADLAAMIDGVGGLGPRYIRGRFGRLRGERWAKELIAAVRDNRLNIDDRRPLSIISWHRDEHGRLLDTPVAPSSY
ncbi:hypothetical protein [Alkalilimnicola ehrlichii]|uniref:hypothetical protein n=1 Tax=Alkalilimnicola ehrlichii TaxID=351052 RepID=UPI001C6ED867|nr:hypothetical protein [Alkalilimnicola ehrlichii]